MKCFVCGSEMRDYIKKTIDPEPFERNYVRCEQCGLVLCKTLYEMSSEEWENMNESHKEYQGSDSNPVDPNWLFRLHCQAKLFAGLAAHNVWEANMRFVDYGCGDGKLTDYVQNELSTLKGGREQRLLKYDKYMRPEDASDYLFDKDMIPGSFDIVVTCSVFEHLLGRHDIDEIIGLLNDEGILCMHTLVCEEVPQDSQWSYLLGGHCILWTNRSMGLLFEQYGFVGYAYHVEARMWFFFKESTAF